MCDRCTNRFAAPVPGPYRRKKLWETDPKLHCSIIGTCLTLGDLRRTAAKLRVDIPAHFEDYDVHGHFAGSVGRPGPISKALHKILERKHAAAVRRFGKAKDTDAVNALWARCLEDGDIPGPFWALITHPASPPKVVWNAFGHVHMLSHLLGSSNSADIRRLKSLEDERDVLVEDLATAKRRVAEGEFDVRRLMEQHADDIRELGLRLHSAQSAASRLEVAEQRIRDLENDQTHQFLQSRLAETEQQLAAEMEMRQRDAGNVTGLGSELAELRRANDQLQVALSAATEECEDLEAVLCKGLANSGERTRAAIDLCGSRIVYVGGRTALVPHLRALVQRSNGSFVYHDGGIEEKGERLSEVLAQGDAVLCPVDCVSHGACRLAKRVCKQRSKAFVPLRSSGMSSFVSGLREIASVIKTDQVDVKEALLIPGKMNRNLNA